MDWLRRGGYDGFTYDITEAISQDATELHELIVDVWDPTEAADGVPLGKQRAHVSLTTLFTCVQMLADEDSYILCSDIQPAQVYIHDGHVGAFIIGSSIQTLACSRNAVKRCFDCCLQTQPGGITYTACSGIWQTVWLEAAPSAQISRVDPVPDIDAGHITVTVRGSGAAHGRSVVTVVHNNNYAGPIIGSGLGLIDGPMTIPMPNAQLWSPDTPNLYALTTYLFKPSVNISNLPKFTSEGLLAAPEFDFADVIDMVSALMILAGLDSMRPCVSSTVYIASPYHALTTMQYAPAASSADQSTCYVRFGFLFSAGCSAVLGLLL